MKRNTALKLHQLKINFVNCVGHAIVQGDEAPVGEVAQGVEVHGVPVRHGEKQEKEEGKVEQEVEGQEEENAQRRRHMTMDEMKVKRHVRGLEPM